ncbi:hypothetical protein PAXRUDRAFT_737213 [Paxillus rubicundulus Ve08.2h10]|uniref:Uncharacterized protein n=1 Tax=Paxillus rubicundulus Ve08.2h10 TaxID=930991 RepID=A0A0D0D1H3_9AGAM|nr:hypothetical protein PAXRUDRAFT_737213 [Paxillus rubicundulus Ve08.2h10]
MGHTSLASIVWCGDNTAVNATGAHGCADGNGCWRAYGLSVLVGRDGWIGRVGNQVDEQSLSIGANPLKHNPHLRCRPDRRQYWVGRIRGGICRGRLDMTLREAQNRRSWSS